MKYEFMSRYMRPEYIVETKKNQKEDGEHSVGKRIKFDNHRFSTDDEKEADYIRNHRDFGKGDGDTRAMIWEVGNPAIPGNLGKSSLKVQVSSTPAELEMQKIKEQEDTRIIDLEKKVDDMTKTLDTILLAINKKVVKEEKVD